MQDWLRLLLFEDVTRLPGHISRPTQVHLFYGCYLSMIKLIKCNFIAELWGLVDIQNCIISYLGRVKCIERFKVHIKQMNLFYFSQKFHNAEQSHIELCHRIP